MGQCSCSSGNDVKNMEELRERRRQRAQQRMMERPRSPREPMSPQVIPMSPGHRQSFVEQQLREQQGCADGDNLPSVEVISATTCDRNSRAASMMSLPRMTSSGVLDEDNRQEDSQVPQVRSTTYLSEPGKPRKDGEKEVDEFDLY